MLTHSLFYNINAILCQFLKQHFFFSIWDRKITRLVQSNIHFIVCFCLFFCACKIWKEKIILKMHWKHYKFNDNFFKTDANMKITRFNKESKLTSILYISILTRHMLHSTAIKRLQRLIFKCNWKHTS